METARTLLSSPPSPFPLRTHLKNCLSSSVVMLHEQAVSAVTSAPTTSIARNFPTSVLMQEQRDELRRMSQVTLDRRQMESRTLVPEGNNSGEADQLMYNYDRLLLSWPSFSNLLSPQQTGQSPSWSLTMQSVTTNKDEFMAVESTDVIDLAKKALSASKEAALLAQKCTVLDDTVSTSFGSVDSSNHSTEEVKTVRSTRRLKRQSKNRRGTKTNEIFHEPYSSRKAGVHKKNEGVDPKDPLRFFLWGPETKQLLTAKEETELIAQVQDLMRLEEVKDKLKLQFGREPTFVEWADAVGHSYSVMQSQIHSGNRSREKLINANLRMVVHIAKQYRGRGLSLQDLLQRGSIGLMKSIEKFKPQVGCRFATYSYWWIRQTVKKAIFQHSRTIRLPENVYHILAKVLEAKRSYIQEGNRKPTKDELAKRTGITVEKLERLLCLTRMPYSMQQPVWADQGTTYQEVTADTEVEIPELSVAKQLMRKHVRGLLKILNPKERQIIKLRFGIEDGKQKSLSEIGNVISLSKERVRQLESRALYKLKQCLDSHGLEAYADLIV
ncbi:RNA polymerase sigma factor sigF, chloroplastic [Mercurialis annua]|uniref:RNA polymerase sigma factor sigF, chloroplastic n=1 Tax=Mercurialis annua TaxID=3986 RepID=UPI002160CBE2|nr:RNA polymerase sigma factor sigF, chloroplastic [Mercurialis annua]